MTISKQIYANNAKTTVAYPVLATDTTIQVSNASIFPSPTAGEYFLTTLDNAGAIEVIQVTNVVINSSGNFFTGITRGLEGTTPSAFPVGSRIDNRVTAGTLTNFTRFVDVMADISSVDQLSTPTNSNSNSYICYSEDVEFNPITAIASNNNTWSFDTHKTIQVTGSVATSTTTSVYSTSISNLLGTLNTGEYIIQFEGTGVNVGLARMITSVGINTVGWSTPLPYAPGTGDQFRIYKSDAQIFQDLLSTSDNFFGIGTGTGDTVSVATTPSVGFALIDGKQIKVRWPASNTTNSPTVNINTTGALPITCDGGNNIPVGAFQTNEEVLLRYNAETNSYEAINLSAGVTPTQFNNSNLFATTGFVQKFGIQSSNWTTFSANATLTAAVVGGTVQAVGNTIAIALALPVTSGLVIGARIEFLNSSLYNVTVSATNPDTLYSVNNGTGPIVITPGDTLTLEVGAFGKWIAVGGSCQLPHSYTMTGAYWTTQPILTNNTSLATTAFVKASGVSYSYIVGLSSNTTLTTGNLGSFIVLTAVVTITLPQASTCPGGSCLTFSVPSGVQTCTITAHSGDQINAPFSGVSTSFSLNGSEEITFVSNGTAWYTSHYSATIGITQTAGTSTGALATTAFVQNAVSGKANIASPTFTGTVTAPTIDGTLYGVATHLGQSGGTTAMTFNYSGQSGQPSWVWGTNDGVNIYVYNPNNFNMLGVGQGYANYSGSRSINTWYQNTESKPIHVSITIDAGGDQNGANLLIGVNSGSYTLVSSVIIKGADYGTLSGIVPPGWYYYLQSEGSFGISSWAELR